MVRKRQVAVGLLLVIAVTLTFTSVYRSQISVGWGGDLEKRSTQRQPSVPAPTSSNVDSDRDITETTARSEPLTKRPRRTLPPARSTTKHLLPSPASKLPTPRSGGQQVNVPDSTMVVCLISHGWKAGGYESPHTIKGSQQSLPLALKGILRSLAQEEVAGDSSQGGDELNSTSPGERSEQQMCKALHFVFIVGQEDEVRIRKLLEPIHYTPGPIPVSYQFVHLNETQLAGWMDHINHRASHRTGAAGNVKYFYPNIFPNVNKVLMLDSDVLVVKNVCELWRQFGKFKAKQLFAFAPQWPQLHPTKDNQVNAGVALLHIERMRNHHLSSGSYLAEEGGQPGTTQKEALATKTSLPRFSNSPGYGWLELSHKAIANWGAKKMQPKCCAHGDQSAFHMVRFLEPATMGYLSRSWNINKCHDYQKYPRASRAKMRELKLEKQQRKDLEAADHGREAPDNEELQPAGVSLLPIDYHKVGIIHLGCCKMCTRKQIGDWAAAYYDLVANVSLREDFLVVPPSGEAAVGDKTSLQSRLLGHNKKKPLTTWSKVKGEVQLAQVWHLE